MCELVGTIRSDPTFCDAFDSRLDELLVEQDVCRRSEDGYLSIVDPNLPPEEIQRRLLSVFGALEDEGYNQGAAHVLQRANQNASLNSVGHICIVPD